MLIARILLSIGLIAFLSGVYVLSGLGWLLLVSGLVSVGCGVLLSQPSTPTEEVRQRG